MKHSFKVFLAFYRRCFSFSYPLRILFSIFFVITVITVASFEYKINSLKKNIEKTNQNFDIKYELEPYNQQFINSTVDTNFPRVIVAPSSKIYYLEQIRENFLFLLKVTDNFALASKRISEMKRWKNEINLEKTLLRYESYMSLYLDKKNIDYIYMNRLLEGHRYVINNIISSTDKSYHDKSNLYAINEKNFENLKKKLIRFIPRYNSNRIDYTAKRLIDENNYGTYSALISKASIDSNDLSISSLRVNNKTYYPSETEDGSYIKFNNIDISDRNFVSVDYARSVVVNKFDWQIKLTKDNLKHYSSEVVLKKGQKSLEYENNFGVPIRIQIQSISHTNGKTYQKPLVKTLRDTYLFPSNNSKSIIFFEVPDNTLYSSVILNLISPHTLDKDHITEAPKMQILSLLNSNISLIKSENNNKYYLKLSEQIRNNQAKRLIFLYAYSLILVLLLAAHMSKINTYIKNIAYKNFLNLVRFLNKFRLLLFFIASLGILLDIFFIKYNFSAVIVLLSLFWIFYIVGYHLDSSANFFYSFLFLTTSIILAATNQELYAEKFATWSFVILIIGLFHALIEIRFNLVTSYFIQNVCKNKYDVYISIPLKFLGNFLIIFENIIKTLLINYHEYLFKNKPIKIQDYVLILLKLVFSLVLLIMISYAFFSTTMSLIHWKTRLIHMKTRTSLNPTIKTIEPTFVYKAMKVVIYGNNFGWKGSEHVLLAKKDEAIITDLWTDTKIVFTVPLHWKPGTTVIWIQKPITWEGKKINAESEKINIKLLKSTGKTNADDEAYFEQLKTLSPETLQINGYE